MFYNNFKKETHSTQKQTDSYHGLRVKRLLERLKNTS